MFLLIIIHHILPPWGHHASRKRRRDSTREAKMQNKRKKGKFPVFALKLQAWPQTNLLLQRIHKAVSTHNCSISSKLGFPLKPHTILSYHTPTFKPLFFSNIHSQTQPPLLWATYYATTLTYPSVPLSHYHTIEQVGTMPHAAPSHTQCKPLVFTTEVIIPVTFLLLTIFL